MNDDQLREFSRADRLTTYAFVILISALPVGIVLGLFLQRAGVPAVVADAVFIGAATVTVGGFLLWVVGDMRSRRAIRRLPNQDVNELLDKERWPEAIALLEPRLAGAEPEEVVEVSNLLADAYAATGRNAEAEALIRRSIEATGDANDTLGEQLTCLATVVRRQERVEEAEEIYARALDVLRKKEDKEATVFALRNVAYLYWSIGQEDRARQIYDEMPECDPDQLEFLNSILKPFREPALPEETDLDPKTYIT